MEKITSLTDLECWDTPKACPSSWGAEDISALERDIQRAVARFRRETHLSFGIAGPSEFQDGALFMCAEECEFAADGQKNGVRSGLYFSKFGRFVSAKHEDGKSEVSGALWESLLEALQSDYRFRLVATELLGIPYKGVFEAYRCRNWEERFFCPWYSHPQSTAGKAWS